MFSDELNVGSKTLNYCYNKNMYMKTLFQEKEREFFKRDSSSTLASYFVSNICYS